MVSNNINPQYQYQYQHQTAPNMSPSFNAMPAQLAPNMTGLEDTSLGKTLDKSQQDTYLTLGLTVPAYFGLAKLHQIITKANGGEYEKSLIGKIAGFGDKIANSGFAQSKFMQGIGNGYKTVKTFVVDNIINKNKVLSAMVNTPSVPEASMAKGVGSAIEDVTKDFVKIIEESATQTFQQPATKVEKSILEALKKQHFVDELAKLGLDEATFNAIKQNPEANLDTIKQICQRFGNTSTRTGKIIKNTLTFEQVGNRLKAMTESSKLGKFLAKAGNRGAFGLFVGGGIFMIMSAHAIAEAITRTKNAEKGDKFSTFMEGFLGNISWVATFPLGLKLMNAVAGLKYVGKTPAQVQAYRDALKVFNEQAKAGFASKADYKAAKDILNAAKKAGNAGFFGKLFSIPGKILSYGREVARPFKQINPTTFGQKLGNVARKVPYLFRNKFLAVAIGLGTYMTIFSPIVDKLFVKASHALFGKPKHSMYDDEEETKPQEIAQNPVQNPAMNTAPATTQTIPTQPIEHTSPSNLLNIYNNRQNGSTNVNNPQQADRSNDDKQLEPVRTYIPSPVGVQVTGEDPTAANAALQRSEMAEKKALEVLAMKF